MAPKTKVNREMIIKGGINLIREDGYEQLSARNLAARIGCSTQPILYAFDTIEEIKDAVYDMVNEYHLNYIMANKGETVSLKEMGLNYIRFAEEERNFFMFLFQANKFGGLDLEALMDSEDLGSLINDLGKRANRNEQEAKEMFVCLFSMVHGLASLVANKSMSYDKEKYSKMLSETFAGLVK